MAKDTNRRVDIVIFGLLCVGTGAVIGLLCHYAEYGWNPGTKTGAKVSVVIVLGFLLLSLALAVIKLSGAHGKDVKVLPHSTDDSIKPGDHFWATFNGQLLVVMKDNREGRYQACGAWQCGIDASDLTLIARISRPQGTEQLELYYL